MIPQKYVPNSLSNKDKKLQRNMLKKSRKLYKDGKYFTRRKVKSFKSKISPHIKRAMKIYNMDKIKPGKELSIATKCSVKGLEQIVSKGRGAYYSSGSRPNQTAESWGLARLASAITGGNSSKVDYHILEKECQKDSKALKLAIKKKKLNPKKIQLGGNFYNYTLSKSDFIDKKPVKIFGDSPDPEFKPNLSPIEIFKLGSFGGTYWRPISSRITGKTYKNEHLKISYKNRKLSWEDLPDNYLTSDVCNPKINNYKTKAGTSLKFWEDKGWISEHDPYGWIQWYCNYYLGRRIPDEDKRQIDRWKKFAGPKGRFRLWLITKITQKNAKFDDNTISKKIRQGLQHWGYVLTKKDFENEIHRRKPKQL